MAASSNFASYRLGDVLKVKHGKSQKEVADDSGPYPIIGSGGEFGYASEFLHNKPSVLIGRKGTIDRPIFMDSPFWVVDTMFYTEIFKGFDPKYIFYLFQSIDWRSKNEASGVPSLSGKIVEEIEVRIPDYQTQRAIAKALSDIDELIAALNSEKDKVIGIRLSLLQEIFIRNKFGKVNFAIESMALGDVIKDINDGGTPNTKIVEYFGGSLNWAVVDDVIDEIYTTKTKLTELGLQNSSAILWPKGTLILTTGATIGKVGIAMLPTATKQGLCGIVFNQNKVNTKYMKYWFQMNTELLKSLSQGSTIKEVRPPELKKVKLELPNLTNQDQIVASISDFDLKIGMLVSEIAKYEYIKQGMAHDLLNGKVRLV